MFHIHLDAIGTCITALSLSACLRKPALPNPSAIPVTCIEIHQDLPGAGQQGHTQLLCDVAR